MKPSFAGLDAVALNPVGLNKAKILPKSWSRLLPLFSVLLLGTISRAHAAAAETLTVAQLLEYQNIAWIIWGGVLVFFMQAGFALLESGSVRAKNAVNVMMKNYTDMCIGGLAFYLVGFGLMMGNNHSGFVGTDHFMPVDLSNMDWAVMFFQMMFAATAVTIASGAMAERVSFIGYAVAACLICLFIYPVFASWVWGGYFGGSGWLAELGFIDFA